MIRMCNGVSLSWLEDPIVRVIRLICAWSSQEKCDVWVTSANDGSSHSPTSCHWDDRALDVQTHSVRLTRQNPLRGDAAREMTSLYRYLRAKLEDEGYDVIFDGGGTNTGHRRHCHIEFDIKKTR